MFPSIIMLNIYYVENRKNGMRMEDLYLYLSISVTNSIPISLHIFYTESKGTSLHRTMNTLGFNMWNSSINNTLYLKNIVCKIFLFL